VRWPVYGLFGVNYFVSLIAVVVLLGVIGWCFETFFFRRMRKIATREENSMLLAVGTVYSIKAFIMIMMGGAGVVSWPESAAHFLSPFNRTSTLPPTPLRIQ
jgi:branched-subunit amino acid ABC-type transport system permease component